MKSIVAAKLSTPQEFWGRRRWIGLALALWGWSVISQAEAAAPRGLPGKSSEPMYSVEKLPVAQGAATGTPHVIPLRQPTSRARAAGASSQSKVAAASAAQPPASAPALTANFAGVDDSGRFQPADPTLAAGPNHVVQAVNSLFRITDKTGGNAVTVDPAVLFSDFFATNTDIDPIPFDPWAVYDHFANRFVILWDTADFTNGDKGFFLIQVSKTADPTQGWDLFAQRSDVDGTTDTDAPADYQKLGFDNTNFYVTSNQFHFFQNFAYTKIRVMAKSQFYTPTGTTKFVDFIDTPDAMNAQSFTIQPCVTFGTPGKGYLVSAPFGGSNYLSLFSITGTWPNATNTLPVLTVDGKVNINTWNFPDEMPQPGGGTVDGSDGRLMNAVFRNGVVYTGHSVKAGGFNLAAGIKSFRVDTRAKILDEVIGAANEGFSYPMVTADANDNVYAVFNRGSDSVFVECRYTVKTPADATFQASNVLKAGTATTSASRWGDYNGIAIDPANGSVWFSSMFATSFYGCWVGNLGGGGVDGDSQVTATFDKSTKTLTLTGDGGKNNLTVKHDFRNGRLTITAGTKTKINGKATDVFTVDKNKKIKTVNCNLGAGDDTIMWDGLVAVDFSLHLGTGRNRATFRLCKIDNFVIDSGSSPADVYINIGSLLGDSRNRLVNFGSP